MKTKELIEVKIRRRNLMIRKRIEELLISLIILGMFSGLIPLALLMLMREYAVARIIIQLIIACILTEAIRKIIFDWKKG